ncbi:23958_t:CDS:1 [Dentiscutata erythropus]|uniref:23958_t:CDS:1 n=1 Tax=Dentiscutata erythropus TaxID=1348616 RepID=A0A9N9IER9_9GLOM|nr:23958_t:CDS:1 [Dentiscutata erythropus]
MNKEYQSSFLVNNKLTPRVCAFINSGNNHMIQNQVIDNPRQLVKLPFPPKINSQDLVILHPDGRIPKTPNAFIIYRKLFFETARTNGYNLPMNIISSMASQSWEQESNEVKIEYKRIAKEAFNYRNELFPKVKVEKKRNQWKMISFDKPSTRKVKVPKSMKSTNKKSINKSIKNKQLESSTVEPELNLFPETTDANNLNNENSQILNLDLFANWADFFDSQNGYPSPDLSTISSGYTPNTNIDMTEEFEFDLEVSAQCFDSQNSYPSPDLSTISNNHSPNMIEEFEFNIETSTQCFDLPVQQDQQVNINENQYGLGIFDFSNENENLETIQIFDTQNVFNMVDDTPYYQSLSTTINQDYLNDALISYEMGFDYSF